MYKGELILGFQKYSNISNDKKSFRIITFDNLISRQHCLVDKKENCGRYKKLSLILKKVINPAPAGNLLYFDLYLTSFIILLCKLIMIPLLECPASGNHWQLTIALRCESGIWARLVDWLLLSVIYNCCNYPHLEWSLIVNLYSVQCSSQC